MQRLIIPYHVKSCALIPDCAETPFGGRVVSDFDFPLLTLIVIGSIVLRKFPQRFLLAIPLSSLSSTETFMIESPLW